ncbi:lyase family protein [Corynebacterium pyruviciproducens]
MPVGALNSYISKKGYVTWDFEQIWLEPSQVQNIVTVEVTLAQVQAKLGMVPADAAQHIAHYSTISDELVEKVASGKVGNPLVAALDALRSEIPEDYRGWVHFGATSQDILDTARALQIKSSLDWLEQQLSDLDACISKLAEAHADTLMVARTNGQHALPTTLGMRFARWLAELRRSRRRLADVRPRAQLIQFSGAAGTYASMGELGTDVAKNMAKELDLTYEPIPWHASRDSITELCYSLAIYGQTLAKIAEDLFDMQRTDFMEARETMDAHASGSSTMPQKLNPFTTMKISVGARLAAGLAATVLTQPPGSFERDHRQLEVERDALPQIFIAVEGAASKLLRLLPKLTFNTESLAKAAEKEGVLLLTESLMMHLAPVLGQEGAHQLLQDFAAENRAHGTGIKEFLAAHPDVVEKAGDLDWDWITRPESYLGLSERIARDAAYS